MTVIFLNWYIFSLVNMPKRNYKFTCILQKECPSKKNFVAKFIRLHVQKVHIISQADIKDYLKCTKHKASWKQSVLLQDFIFFKASVKLMKIVNSCQRRNRCITCCYSCSELQNNWSFFQINFHVIRTNVWSARMKSEAIVVNVIMPMAVGDLHGDLRKSHLVSKAIDAFNWKELKMVPFLLWYFVPEQRI